MACSLSHSSATRIEHNIQKMSLLGEQKKMVLSFLNEDYEGDTYFPEIDENIWKIDKIEKHDRFDVHYYIRRKI